MEGLQKRLLLLSLIPALFFTQIVPAHGDFICMGCGGGTVDCDPAETPAELTCGDDATVNGCSIIFDPWNGKVVRECVKEAKAECKTQDKCICLKEKCNANKDTCVASCLPPNGSSGYQTVPACGVIGILLVVWGRYSSGFWKLH